MAFRRKFPRRKKRVIRRRRAIPRNPRGILHVTRKTPYGIQMYNSVVAGVPAVDYPTQCRPECFAVGTPVAVVSGASTYAVPFTMNFRLSDVINYSEFVTLADRYKINKVTVNIRYNSNAAESSTQSSLPVLFWTNDYDDQSMGTVNSIRERMGVRHKAFTATRMDIALHCRPRVAPFVYGEVGVGSGYIVPSKSQFVNSDYSGQPHYGIRGYIDNVFLPAKSGTNFTLFTIDITYDLTLKDII